MITETNDGYDLLSFNSFQFEKEESLLDNSFYIHNGFVNLLDYYDIERNRGIIQFDVKDIFTNEKENIFEIDNKDKDENEDKKEEKISNSEDSQRFLVTAVSDKQKTKEKFFEIKKTKQKSKYYKKKGRKKKNSFFKPTINDKNRDDNIRNRILTIFINRIQKYINSKLSKYFKTKSKKKLLKKIENIHKYYSNIEECKNLLKKNIGEIFSTSLSKRCINFTKDYNKNLINNLRNDSNLEINSIFDQTVQQMYENYISNTIPEFNLNKDLERIKQEDENYAANYKNKALNLVKLIYEKVGRKKI